MKDKNLKQTCQQCIYFIQHYVKRSFDTGRYSTVYCGHCTYPRLKTRAPGTPACQHFQPLEADGGPERSDRQESE